MANDLLIAGADINVSTTNSNRSRSGLAPYTGTFGKKELIHLLKRTMLGVSQDDINHFAGMSLQQVVTALLTQGPAPSPPVKHYSNTNDNATVALGQTWVNAAFDGNLLVPRGISLKAWWMGQMINQPRTIEEKMVLFWHNLFATEIAIYNDARYGYQYINTIRQYCMGDYKALTKAITLAPAMLKYLNGYLNRKGSPDENYARELQELFTVGKALNPHYTEQDVIEAAKILTGYQDDPTNISYVFNPARHETGNKTFSSFYSNPVTTITGRTGNAGQDELDDLLNLIFSHPEVAKHIVRKLYIDFVYYKIDADVESNVIEPLADTFRNNNYNILPVLQQLILSEHFFDNENKACFIKPSVNFLVSFAREWKLVFPTTSDLATLYDMWFVAQQYASTMQQNLFDPPSVAGWPAFHQEPSFHRLWINSDTLPKRNQFTDFILYVGYTKNGKRLQADPLALAAGFSNPSDPNILIDDSLDLFYTIPVSTNLKTYLKSILLSGQSQDYYWTNAWVDYVNDPTNTSKKNIVLTRLQSMYKYIMNLSEYHLM